MKTLPLKTLPVAAALTIALGGMGAATEVHAYAYAYSDLEILNGSVIVLAPGTTNPNTFGACVSVGCATFGTPATTSAAQATLGGSGTSLSNSIDSLVATGTGSAFPDATTPVNNAWVLEGPSASVRYTWADSQVISQQELGAPPVNLDGTPNITSFINTRQIAEGSTTGPLGTSGGSTTSATALTTFLTVLGDGARVRFDFDLVLDMLAEIVAPSTGIQALASAGVQVQITDASNALVFSWNVGSNPLGEAAFANDFAFTNVSTTSPGSVSFSDSGSFFAVTEDLVAGTYELSLVAQVDERVEAIPEPGSLALFGIAIVGLYGARRMRMRRVGGQLVA